MRIGAVIVAAGISSKMNNFKPMLKIGSITIIRRIISTLQQAGADPIVLVTGNQADILEKHTAKMGVICLRNSNYAHTRMFDSAKIGLSYLKEHCEKIIFTPADIPLFTTNTVQQLLQTDAMVALPVCKGKKGHPLLINTSLLPRILSYEGSDGLRGAVQACGNGITLVEVQDEGILYDVDTAEDYQQLLSWHNKQLFRPLIQLRLAKEDVFFGQGSALLLRLIHNTCSMRTSCQQMNVSYSKGWNMINNMECALGYNVVIRHPGGANGGNTQLTENGIKLLSQYDQFEQECKEVILTIFQKYFSRSIAN